MRRLLGFLLFQGITLNSALAQHKTLYTSELYRQIITTTDETLMIEDVKLVDDVSPIMLNEDIDFYSALDKKLDIAFDYDSLGLKSNVEFLYLYDITGAYVTIDNINIDTVSLTKAKVESFLLNDITTNTLYLDSLDVNERLRIENARIHNLTGYGGEVTNFEITNTSFSGFFETIVMKVKANYWIQDCVFEEGAYFSADVEGSFIDFLLEGNEFQAIDSNLAFPLDSIGMGSEEIIMKTPVRINFFGDVDQASIVENVFEKDSVEQYLYLEGDYDYMIFSGNDVGITLYPVATIIKQLTMDDNIFDANVVFTDFILQGRNNVLKWEELSDFKLASVNNFDSQMSEHPEEFGYTLDDATAIFNQTSDILQITYKAQSEVELDSLEPFQSLLSSYYRLYKTFKENGQISAANEVYIEMKDVQLKELAFQYKEYGGLEHWIEWQLNSVLRFYTDYGTRPAKAIRISIWVVAIFSVFYFFFPSEWDTKSKGQLIDDYKIFVEKNEKGYFKPFLKLSFGFGRSLMNAFTLSLNSFVTLGFGTIPTTGVARYVCILQGFLGWFLLSIFTASLINQVLF